MGKEGTEAGNFYNPFAINFLFQELYYLHTIYSFPIVEEFKIHFRNILKEKLTEKIENLIDFEESEDLVEYKNIDSEKKIILNFKSSQINEFGL